MKELSKRAQHLATFKNAATKILPFSKFIKNHPTRCNILLQGVDVHVPRCCVEMLRAFGHALTERVWADHVIFYVLIGAVLF